MVPTHAIRLPSQSTEEQCRDFAKEILFTFASYIGLAEKDLEEKKGFFARFRTKKALKKLRREHERLQKIGVEMMGRRISAYIDVECALSDMEQRNK